MSKSKKPSVKAIRDSARRANLYGRRPTAAECARVLAVILAAIGKKPS